MKFLRSFNDGLQKFEGILASVVLLFMIGLAFLQVLLRNVFHTGIGWGDPVVRALVLWVGFLGASIATHQKGHIRFDVVSKFLPPTLKKVAELIAHLASAIVCILLAHAAWNFVLSEKEFGTMLVDQIPSWIGLIIIPISFAIMALRFFFLGLLNLGSLFSSKGEAKE